MRQVFLHRICAVVVVAWGILFLPMFACAEEPASTHKAISVERAVEGLREDLKTPGRYALIIGASQFKDKRISALPACANDARELYQVLTNPSIGMFPKDHVTLLTDQQVTRRQIVKGLVQLQRRAGPEDLILVFFSGHGATDATGEAYWVMADTQIDELEATAMSQLDISNRLKEIKTKRLVTLIDACYSAATAEVAVSKALLDPEKIIPNFHGDGKVIISASKGEQLSVVINDQTHPGYGYSAFAYHAIEALKGAADVEEGNVDGVVTVSEFWNYVKDRVERTAQQMGGRQFPQLKGQIGSQFLLTIDGERLRDRHQQTQRRLALLKQLLAKDQIEPIHHQEGRWYIEQPPHRLDKKQREISKLYMDLMDGQLASAMFRKLRAGYAPFRPDWDRTPSTTPTTPDPPPAVAQPVDPLTKAWQQYLDGKCTLWQYRLAEWLLQAEEKSLTPPERLMRRTEPALLGQTLDRKDQLLLIRRLLAWREKHPEQLVPALGVGSHNSDTLASAYAVIARLHQNGEVEIDQLSRAKTLLSADAHPNPLQQRLATVYVALAHDDLSPAQFRRACSAVIAENDALVAQELERPTHSYLPTLLPNSIRVNLVLVSAGEYDAGSSTGELRRKKDESQHHVRLSADFYIGDSEVTIAQWQKVMGSATDAAKVDTNQPVTGVTWHDAVDFCKRLSDLEGVTYRLPTEAEWEYACRAGTTTPYAGEGRLDDMGWHKDNAGERVRRVKQKEPNDWGLYDMHGNVWEWCADWYDRYGPYPDRTVTDPTGPRTGERKVLRGGSAYSFAKFCRSAARYSKRPDHRSNQIGFRVVMQPVPYLCED